MLKNPFTWLLILSLIRRQKITVLRMMVLQMPIIQTLLLSALNIMFIEDEVNYQQIQFDVKNKTN